MLELGRQLALRKLGAKARMGSNPISPTILVLNADIR